jgi:hypothetical protein
MDIITYETVRTDIQDLLKEQNIPNKDALKNLHRRIEIHNAYKTIANQDDKLMKDVEFLLRSALFLMDLGNQGDWKLQLEAVLGILEST